MFEFEVDSNSLGESEIPSGLRQEFEKPSFWVRENIESLSPLLWEEHCTECAMPSCYDTCDLYKPRNDGKCRRFKDGLSHVDVKTGLQDYVVKIIFKQWGSLLSLSPIAVLEFNDFLPVEKSILRVEKAARLIPDGKLSIAGRRGISSRLARRYKKRLVDKKLNESKVESKPSDFIMEIFNPGPSVVDLTLVIRAEEGGKKNFPYQKRLQLGAGLHREVIGYTSIEAHVDISKKHYISLVPNLSDGDKFSQAMYFGFIGFVKRKNKLVTTNINKNPKKAVKVVVWDLDNTLWDGILVEEGAKTRVQLQPGIVEIIKELDRRGIVSSIASKNDYDTAMHKLRTLGIDEYFVYPEISWGPKSNAISQIIKNFNVGADSIVFIDDSPFEREEVVSQHPQVRVLDAIEYCDILDKPECNPELSVESPRRREFYKNQKARSHAVEAFDGSYFDFVKDCDIKLIISKGNLDSLDRIHELVQRTNQMNFSGNRYSKDQIKKIIGSSTADTYILNCSDKFGDYGTVGFCVVNPEKLMMTDLTFSCRVQSKRIEHAFMIWLMARYSVNKGKNFYAIYNKTDKNMQLGKVLKDIGFNENNKSGIYAYSLDASLVGEGLITITDCGV